VFVERHIAKDLEESRSLLIDNLSRNLPGRTEEYKNLTQDSRVPTEK
jgi:hypothetical protein